MLSDGFRRIYADNEGRSRRPKLLKPGKTVFNVALIGFSFQTLQAFRESSYFDGKHVSID